MVEESLSLPTSLREQPDISEGQLVFPEFPHAQDRLTMYTIPDDENAMTVDFTSRYEREETIKIERSRSGSLLFISRELELASSAVDVLLLRANFGMSEKQIAKRLGVAFGTVDNTIDLSVLRNKEVLVQEGYKPNSGSLVFAAEKRGLLSVGVYQKIKSMLVKKTEEKI